MTLENVKQAAGRWEAARIASSEARKDLSGAIREARAAGHSLAEIAAQIGVSRQRVEQLSK